MRQTTDHLHPLASPETPTTGHPHRRADQHEAVTGEDQAILADTYSTIKPAAVRRQIQALTTELIALATGKNTHEESLAGRRRWCR
ncbi:hypothetical protein [Rhodococcus koreensis]|uniref:hypothetical protein n=1 Tax=Rhodococcus koreensis TaxID=99653 RepID=UPI003672C4C7